MKLVHLSTIRITTMLAVLALAAALAASMAWPARAADQSVSISNFAFSPATVNVNVGDTVTWTNNDAGVPHTASSDSGVFDSGNLQTGGTLQHTFAAAGTFAYHCNVHPNMTGTVVVAAAAGGGGGTPAPGATSAPPATGTGLAPTDEGDSLAPVVIVLGGLALVAGASTFAVVRSRR
jgi:plastocyanin